MGIKGKKAQEEAPKKMGAPTKYKPEYCDKLIKHMSQGYSFESFSAEIDTHRETLYEWAKVHADFSEAKRRAYDINLKFWENAGISGLWGDRETTFNSTVWIFNMKNRHRWRDKQDDEVPKTTVVVNSMKEALKETMEDKTTEELVAIVKGNLKE